MGFGNPMLLWFAMGGAIPVIIHLLHRQRFRRVPWAAMEFLLAAMKKTQRRLRLENLLLLLLRILIMVILALAIARPFFSNSALANIGDTDTHYIVVIDNSYSMGFKKAQKTSLDAAKDAADKIIREQKTTQDDRFSILLMSEFPSAIPSTNKQNLARKIVTGREEAGDDTTADQAFPGIELSHYGTNLYRTMLTVEETLKQSRNMQKKVYLITDLQRSAWEPETEEESKKLQALLKTLSAWEATHFFLIDAGIPNPDNYAIVSLRVEGKPLVTTRRATNFAVDLYNFSDASLESVPVKLIVDGDLVDTKNTFLNSNTITTVRFDHRFHEAGPHTVEAKVEADFLSVDDTRSLSLNVRRSLKALLVDGDPGPGLEGETVFFAFALDPTREGHHFQIHKVTSEIFDAEKIEEFDFITLANVERIPMEKATLLKDYVENGGGLFITLGDKVNALEYNEVLGKEGLDLLPAQIGDPAGDKTGENIRRFVNIDFEHPLFATFRDKLKGALYSLIFREYFRLELTPDKTVRTLATFDDNFRTPAFLEKRVGEGKVLLFSSAIDNDWSESFPGHPPYLVLTHNLGEYLSSRPQSLRNVHVGDPIQYLHRSSGEFGLKMPDGTSLTITARAIEGTKKWFLIQHPTQPEGKPLEVQAHPGLSLQGIYDLTKSTEGDPELLTYFAANISPRDTRPETLHRCEGNLDRIGVDQIKSRYPDFAFEVIGERRPGTGDVDPTTPRSGIWRYLLYLLMAFVLVEMILAWFFGRVKI